MSKAGKSNPFIDKKGQTSLDERMRWQEQQTIYCQSIRPAAVVVEGYIQFQ